jgi:hypothetical protein
MVEKDLYQVLVEVVAEVVLAVLEDHILLDQVELV